MHTLVREHVQVQSPCRVDALCPEILTTVFLKILLNSLAVSTSCQNTQGNRAEENPLAGPESVSRKEQLSQASGEPGCTWEWTPSSTCLVNHSHPGNKLCRWEQSRVSDASLTSLPRKKLKSARYSPEKRRGFLQSPTERDPWLEAI